MNPMKLASLAALLLTTASAQASTPRLQAPDAPGAGAPCWLQAETTGQMVSLSAHTAPGVAGYWTLAVEHRDGESLSAEQSGYVDGSGVRGRQLSRVQWSRGPARLPARDHSARIGVDASGGMIVASGFVEDGGGALPVDADLELRDASGRLLCRTSRVWVRTSH